MAFDDLKAELALLINQMENQPEDAHELYQQVREKLNEMRAFGMPLRATWSSSKKSSRPSSLKPSASPRRISAPHPSWRPGESR